MKNKTIISRDKIKSTLLELANKKKPTFPHKLWNSNYSKLSRFAIKNFSFLVSTLFNNTTFKVGMKNYQLVVDNEFDKSFVSGLLKNGLLSEVTSLGVIGAKNIYNLANSLPYVNKILKGYGLDDLAITRALVLLKNHPRYAKIIEEQIAEILDNKESNNVAKLTTKLVNTIIDLSASSSTDNAISAKFVHEFIKKICNQKLPENYLEVASVDLKLEQTNLTLDEKKLLQNKRMELTKKYTVLDLLKYNFRDYIEIIKDFNQLNFIQTLISTDKDNQELLKTLNATFMEVAFSKEGEADNVSKLSKFIIAAIDLAINSPSKDNCAEIIDWNVVKKIFDLPKAKELLPYKNIVKALLYNEDEFKELTKKIFVYRKEFVEAVSKLLDFVNEKDDEKKNTYLKEFILSFTNILGNKEVAESLKPLVSNELVSEILKLPNAAAILKYKNVIDNLTEEKTIEKFQDLFIASAQNKKQLHKILIKIFEYQNIPENSQDKKIAFDEMLDLAVDFAISPSVIEKFIPLVNKNLVDNLFEIISNANLTSSVNAQGPEEVSSQRVQDIIISTANAVLQKEEIRERIDPKNLEFVVPIFNSMAKETLSRSAPLKEGNKFLADIIRKLPFETIADAINSNKEAVVPAIDHALGKLPLYKDLIEKFEVKGKDIVECIHLFKNSNTLNKLADCVESPKAINIAALLIAEPKLISIAVGKLFNYCKNSIGSYLSTKQETMVDVQGVTEAVQGLGGDAIKIPSSMNQVPRAAEIKKDKSSRTQ